MTQKLNKIKKGFTLTELIIVIVIIGILAAVLIPSISGYVKKAKVSKGVQEAAEMNTILAAEAVYQDKEYFEGYEIKKILEEADFTLTSNLEDYRFWYDRSTNQVKYLSMEEAFSNSGEKKTASSSTGFSQDCIEALSEAHKEYLYIDSYNDELTEAIDIVRNLITNSLKAENKKSADLRKEVINESKTTQNVINVLDKMDEEIGKIATKISQAKIKGLSDKTSIVNFVNTFDTYNTIYVDNNLMYNRAYFVENPLSLNSDNIIINPEEENGILVDISHMQFETDIEQISSCISLSNKVKISLNNPIIIPSTVESIQSGAFTNISFATSIVVSELTLKEGDGVFSEAAQEKLSTSRTNVSFVTLYLNKDFFIDYYNAEAKLEDGTYITYRPNENDKDKHVNLETIFYSDDKLVKNTTDVKDDKGLVSKYLVPSIRFEHGTVDFSKITKLILRRSIVNNVCMYSGILVDKDLNAYKIESFGYITDIEWHINQDYISYDPVTYEPTFGSKSATIEVYLPAYIYNFSNFKGCSMAVTVLPKCIRSREEKTFDGTAEVFDGEALVNEPIIFYIEDGVFDKENNRYVFRKEITDLTALGSIIVYPADESETKTYACNYLDISTISIYQEKEDNTKEYLFNRYYPSYFNNVKE